MPKYFILYSSLLCGTLSKAFAKSIIIKSVCIFLSLFCDNSCIKEIICDSHDRWVLKENIDICTDILTLLFTKSLETGKVPSDWNHANVTPVLRKGDKHNPGNYRNDGVRTSSFTRVYVFYEFINTIPRDFYGFHCGMSTRTFNWNVSVCFRCKSRWNCLLSNIGKLKSSSRTKWETHTGVI
jgi:hypothetical protein